MSTRLSVVVVAAFLVTSSSACSKDSGDGKGASPATATTSASSAAANANDSSAEVDASLPDGGLAARPPKADDWEDVDVSKADLKVRVPSGAAVPADRAGHDAKFAGSFFRVVMPSGYDVLFAERHGAAGADVTAEKLAFRAKTKGKGVIVYEAPDAFVITREDSADAGGRYCESTACGTIAGRPICATATGGRTDGTIFKKLTDTECLAVVTIARSIKAR